MVIWIIGLSASGKTTLAEEMLNILKTQNSSPWVLLDGDHCRALFGKTLGHNITDRRKNAERIQSICSYLDSQGISVIVPILSIFTDQQKQNRHKFSSYKQIYLKAEFQKLVERDNKNLYKKALANEEQHVVGIDIEFPEPVNSDLVLDNNATLTSLHNLARNAVKNLNIQILNDYKYTQENLLIRPHHYQYSAYEGPYFLQQYLASRHQYLDAMLLQNEKYALRYNRDPKQLIQQINEVYQTNADYSSILSIPIIADYIKSQQIEYNKQEDEIVTLPYLLDLVLSGPAYEIKTIYKLIRRFEVSKRIYASYHTLEFKKLHSQDFNCLINYPLFGIALLKFHPQADKTEQIILENALLKIGDLIISAKETLSQPIVALLCRVFIRAETHLIKHKYAL